MKHFFFFRSSLFAALALTATLALAAPAFAADKDAKKTSQTPAAAAAQKAPPAGKAPAKEAKTAAKVCDMELTANDKMQFSTKELKIGAECTSVKIAFKHVGKLPKKAMGHNLVIAEKNKVDQLIKEGLKAGPKKDYLPDSPHLIAATKLLGGGETDTLTLTMDQLQGKDLQFFCLFPGHTTMMRGNIVIEKDPAQKSS